MINIWSPTGFTNADRAARPSEVFYLGTNRETAKHVPSKSVWLKQGLASHMVTRQVIHALCHPVEYAGRNP